MKKFTGDLVKYSQEDFVAFVDSKHGWAISAQAKDILNGQSFDEQNPSAMRYILAVAEEKGERQLARELREYLGIK